MDYDFSFWSNQDQRWPTAVGYVFLAEVVLRVGKKLFPATWKGTDPAGKKPERKLTSSGEWQWVPERDAWDRYTTVQKKIAELAVAGRIVTGLRPVAGGAVTNIHALLWQTEHLAQRFYRGKMNPAAPFSADFLDGDRDQYIFVTADSLAEVLASTSPHVGTDATAEPPRKKRGRPKGSAKYDWAAFDREAERIYNFHGPFAPSLESNWTPAVWAREAKDWCSTTWGADSVPADFCNSRTLLDDSAEDQPAKIIPPNNSGGFSRH